MSTGTRTQHKYLEAIFAIEQTGKPARVRDIAERVGVHKSSATGALRRLKEAGLVEYEPYEAPTLTEQGRREAREVVARHRVLKDFLTRIIGVEQSAADSEARNLRHALNREVLGKFACFLAFLQMPDHEEKTLAEYREFARRALEEKNCEAWMREYLSRSELQNNAKNKGNNHDN